MDSLAINNNSLLFQFRFVQAIGMMVYIAVDSDMPARVGLNFFSPILILLLMVQEERRASFHNFSYCIDQGSALASREIRLFLQSSAVLHR
jgi:hypothetical protein